jgi:hypothetical protein
VEKRGRTARSILPKIGPSQGNRQGLWCNPFSALRQRGIKVDPLKLQVQPKATFWMQPCRFVRDNILSPLKALIDHFVAENVFIADHNCAFASLLVVVHKKDGEICMEVNYL